MRYNHLFYILIFCCSLVLSASDKIENKPNEDTMTLSRALALTLSRNPELEALSLETKAAWARRLQASLRPNPELEFELEEFGGTAESSGFDAAESSIFLSQLIELGDKRNKRRRVADIEKELACLELKSSQIRLFTEVKTAYIDALAAKRKLLTARKLLEPAEKSLQTVEKRVKAGKDSPIEKTKAAVAAAKLKIKSQEAQRDYLLAKDILASYWGEDEADFEHLTGNIEKIGSLIKLKDIHHKLKNNPLNRSREKEIDRNKAVLELENAESVSDITIGAGIKHSNENGDNTFMVAVAVPLPVFDRNQGSKQEAIYNLAKSRKEREALWLKLKKELNTAYQQYYNAYNSVISLKDVLLPAAEDMYEAAATAYQNGKSDYLSLLDAQRTLFEMKNEYIEKLAEYHRRKISFLSYLENTETENDKEKEQQ